MSAPGSGHTAPGGDSIRLEDAHDLADVETFLTRAKTADPTGAVRISAREVTVSLTVCLVPGAGLFGAGGVLGLRALRVGEPVAEPGDVVVSIDAVLDRVARMKRTGELRLSLPPVQVVAPWAGHAPPRSGWESLGQVEASTVRQVADAGIAEITTGAGGPAAAPARSPSRICAGGSGRGPRPTSMGDRRVWRSGRTSWASSTPRAAPRPARSSPTPRARSSSPPSTGPVSGGVWPPAPGTSSPAETRRGLDTAERFAGDQAVETRRPATTPTTVKAAAAAHTSPNARSGRPVSEA